MKTLFGLCLSLITASGSTVTTWVAVTGSWSNAANWSGGAVPNNGGGVTYAVVLPNRTVSTYSVFADVDAVVDSLTLEGFGAQLEEQASHTLTTGTLTNRGQIFLGGRNALTVNGATNNAFLLQISSGSALFNGDVSNSSVFRADFSDIGINGNVTNSQSFGGISADFVVNGSFDNSGVVGGGQEPLTLAVSGTFQNTASGELVVETGAQVTLASYVQRGQLFLSTGGVLTAGSYLQEGLSSLTSISSGGVFTVSGNAVLGGTLAVSVGKPFADGARLLVMSYGARTGQFDSVRVLGLPAGQSATVEYGANDLFVVVHGTAIPEPGSALLAGAALGLLVGAAGRNSKKGRSRNS